jgi:hypothetical protein
MRRIAWLAALVVFGVAGSVSAQQDKPEGRRAEATTSGASAENIGIDRAAAIGHALCMAIEGSELWSWAERAGSQPAQRTTTEKSTDIASALQEHSRAAFQGSNTLFDAVKSDKSAARTADSQACEEFYQAARRYSQALEACCTQSTARAGATASKGRAQASSMTDKPRMILLNHAVKEAVGGVALREMIKHHNARSDVATALTSHAAEMLRSSDQALRVADTSQITTRSAAKPATRGNTAEVPKRDPAVTTTKAREQDPAARPAEGGEDLAALASAVIDAAKKLESS